MNNISATNTPRRKGHVLTGIGFLKSDIEFIDQMSPEHFAILTTKGSYKDKAKALNIPVGTVRSRLHRARKAVLALRAAS